MGNADIPLLSQAPLLITYTMAMAAASRGIDVQRLISRADERWNKDPQVRAQQRIARELREATIGLRGMTPAQVRELHAALTWVRETGGALRDTRGAVEGALLGPLVVTNIENPAPERDLSADRILTALAALPGELEAESVAPEIFKQDVQRLRVAAVHGETEGPAIAQPVGAGERDDEGLSASFAEKTDVVMRTLSPRTGGRQPIDSKQDPEDLEAGGGGDDAAPYPKNLSRWGRLQRGVAGLGAWKLFPWGRASAHSTGGDEAEAKEETDEISPADFREVVATAQDLGRLATEIEAGEAEETENERPGGEAFSRVWAALRAQGPRFTTAYQAARGAITGYITRHRGIAVWNRETYPERPVHQDPQEEALDEKGDGADHSRGAGGDADEDTKGRSPRESKEESRYTGYGSGSSRSLVSEGSRRPRGSQSVPHLRGWRKAVTITTATGAATIPLLEQYPQARHQ